MILSKMELALWGLEYLKDYILLSLEKIAEGVGVKSPSTVGRWINNQSVPIRHFDRIIKFCDKIIGNDENKKDEFNKGLIKQLNVEDYNFEKVNFVLGGKQSLIDKMHTLLKDDVVEKAYWSNSDIEDILSELRSLLRVYQDYITLSEQKLDYKSSYLAEKLFSENYIIINFASNYKVAVAFFEGDFEEQSYQQLDSLKNFRKDNYLDLMVLFTSKDTKEEIRGNYLNAGNIFIEKLTKLDLIKGSFSNLSYDDVYDIRNGEMSKLYARIAFDKVSDYFVIIKNDMLFKQYSKDSMDKTNDFRSFIDRCFIKDIMNYSYLSRHALYFERESLKKSVEEITKERKIGTVVELFFSNSFLSSAICDKCNKVLLFSGADIAVNYIREKGHEIIPKNIEVIKSHIDPEYISYVLQREGIQDVDLVILGMGMGSCVRNLNEYLRHINNWLSPRGTICISFTNAESIILKKLRPRMDRFEYEPAFFSDYWQYTDENRIKCLTHIHQYRLEDVKYKVLANRYKISNCYTYPFLSGLMEYNTKERDLLEELRQIDKSASKTATKGHFICITGQRNLLQYEIENEICKIILKGLKKRNIQYIIAEKANIVNSNKYKILVKDNLDMEADAIKLVALQKNKTRMKNNDGITVNKRQKEDVEYIDLLILPADRYIDKRKYQGNLIDEKRKNTLFGEGPISPLVIFPEVREEQKNINKKIKQTDIDKNNKPADIDKKIETNLYSAGLDSLNKSYVVFSAGDKKTAIVMSREDFIKLLSELKVHRMIDILRDEL